MAVPRCRLLVFSDLDGTLLDKQTYSWTPAEGAIRALAARDIPLILSSSKTLSEMRVIASAIGIQAPFIFENGAGAALPQGVFPALQDVDIRQGCRVRLFGGDRARVLEVLHRRRSAGDRLEGFDDWSVDEIAAVTGLDVESAARAKDRLATEPFLWRDSEESWPAFAAALEQEGITIARGGRFWCAMGRFDKGDALRWLRGLYCEEDPEAEFITVALGDSPNDVGMLEAADVAVVVNSDNASRMDVRGPTDVRLTEAYGPSGWQQAVTEILAEYPPA